MNIKTVLIGLGLFFASQFAYAEEMPLELLDAELPAAHQKEIIDAVLLHRKGVEGDEVAVEAAVALLEPIEANLPPIGIGFLGSLYTLKGRDASNVTGAMRFTNRGIQYLDQAVELEPSGYSVRMLRAMNNIQLPQMFGRHDKAIEDMKLIIELYKSEDHSRSDETIIELLGYLVEDATKKNNKEEIDRWNKLLAQIESK